MDTIHFLFTKPDHSFPNLIMKPANWLQFDSAGSGFIWTCVRLRKRCLMSDAGKPESSNCFQTNTELQLLSSS